MDKSVRLWHVSMNECLRVFNHNDFVTAIDFCPANDRYFISGSLDEMVRLWYIPEHRVVDYVPVGEMVTAACFSPDGKAAIVGTYKGRCRFYNVEGFKFEYVTQMEVRNQRARRSAGSTAGKKITGLQFMPNEPTKLLITSNDSRIRVYDGYTLRCKYKGHRNQNTQIRASFSPCGAYIVCGSEEEHLFMWSTVNSFVPSINPVYTGYRSDKHSSYEMFAAQEDIVTVALFAPEAVRARGNSSIARRARLESVAPPTRAAEALVMGSQGCGTKAEGAGSRRLTQKDIEAEAMAAGEAAVAAAASVGQVMVASGYSGNVRVFENFGAPLWL